MTAGFQITAFYEISCRNVIFLGITVGVSSELSIIMPYFKPRDDIYLNISSLDRAQRSNRKYQYDTKYAGGLFKLIN